MPKPFSGHAIIKILMARFGFHVVSQRGSHVKLKGTSKGKTVATIVPLHRELAHGTLRGILRLAEIEYENFLDES